MALFIKLATAVFTRLPLFHTCWLNRGGKSRPSDTKFILYARERRSKHPSESRRSWSCLNFLFGTIGEMEKCACPHNWFLCAKNPSVLQSLGRIFYNSVMHCRLCDVCVVRMPQTSGTAFLPQVNVEITVIFTPDCFI